MSKSSCDSSVNKIKTNTTNNARDGTGTTNKSVPTAANPGKVLGLKPPSAVKVPSTIKNHNVGQQQNNHSSSSPAATCINNSTTNSSNSNLPAPKDAKMLDKLKFFSSPKDKPCAAQDKTSSSSGANCNSPRLSKSSTRASNSSSGFSSAKSELSDLSYEPSSSSCASSSKLSSSNSNTASPKLSVKSSFGKKTVTTTKASPKPSKKELLFNKNTSKLETPNENNFSTGCGAQTSPQLMKKQKFDVVQQKTSTGNKVIINNEMDGNESNSTTNGNSKLLASGSSKLKPVTSPTCTQIPGFGVKSSGGSIPKPTLAVKGMKPVSTNKQTNECQNDVQSSSSSTVSSGQRPSTTTSSSADNTTNIVVVENNQLKHSNSSMDRIILNEREKFLQNYKAQRSYSSAVMKTSTPSSPVTVGVVSPITHHKKLPLTSGSTAMAAGGSMDLNSSLDSQGGHQSDSNSSHTSGNQSDTASVIYCPSSADEKECSATGGTTANSNVLLRRNKSKSPAVSLTDDNMQKLR